jgi:RNAse (barnase) inhibitor barstar
VEQMSDRKIRWIVFTLDAGIAKRQMGEALGTFWRGLKTLVAPPKRAEKKNRFSEYHRRRWERQVELLRRAKELGIL